MFENILFQEAACKELIDEIQNGALPPSILLYGQALSGKSTLALELARVLTCQDKGLWKCTCWSCRQQRELSQNQVLVLGNSDFSKEIQVCRHFLRETGEAQLELRKQGILLLVWLRSINKVLKRYDEALWGEGRAKTEKQRKAQKAQEEFVELLASFHPKELRELLESKESSGPLEKLFSDKKSLQKKLDRSEELAEILIAGIPQGIPIHQIRQLQQWSYQTSETCKVAILEGADTMNASASNAMLKLLEEPPHNCYFILTTRRKQSLLPTVLSRLRPVSLRERSEQEEAKIIQRIFLTPETLTLKELFLNGRQDYNTMQKECQIFLRSLREHKPFFMVRPKLEKISLEAFLQNLGFLLQNECNQLGATEHNFFWYQKFLQLSSQAMERHRIYHEAPILLLQNLYLQLIP